METCWLVSHIEYKTKQKIKQVGTIDVNKLKTSLQNICWRVKLSLNRGRMCPFFSSTEPPVHHHQIKNGGTNNSHVTLLPHTVDVEGKKRAKGGFKEKKRKKKGEVGGGMSIMEDWSHGYDMEEWACGSRRQFFNPRDQHASLYLTKDRSKMKWKEGKKLGRYRLDISRLFLDDYLCRRCCCCCYLSF